MCIMYLTSLLLAELCICATSWPLIEEQGDTVQEMDFFEMFKKDFGKLLSISRSSFLYPALLKSQGITCMLYHSCKVCV